MRIPINYKGMNLELLDSEDLVAIEMKAKVLDLDDCLAYLHLDTAEVPAEDLVVAKKAWKRGRSAALSQAGDKLFSTMSMRGGGPVALEYLKALNGTFVVEATPSPSAASGFKFNVIMPETPAE